MILAPQPFGYLLNSHHGLGGRVKRLCGGKVLRRPWRLKQLVSHDVVGPALAPQPSSPTTPAPVRERRTIMEANGADVLIGGPGVPPLVKLAGPVGNRWAETLATNNATNAFT